MDFYQRLLTWLATEPKLDDSTLQLFDPDVLSAFKVENQRANTADTPTSSSPITGQENTPNERPSTAPHMAQIDSEASTPEHVATSVPEETQNKGQKDGDCAQLPEHMCQSQSFQRSSAHTH